MSGTDPQGESEAFEAEGPSETMEALLAQQAAVSEKLTGKQVTWVKVISVTDDAVLVDVGEKREGVIPLSDFGAHGPQEKKKGAAEAARPPAVGQRVPVIMVGKNKDGTTLLSFRRAKADLGWELVVKAQQEKQRVRGIVRQAIRGGFLVDIGGVSGFLPASLADLRPVREPAKMVGTGVRCYVIELNQSKKQVVLSRKAVLEEEVTKRRSKILSDLRVGEVKIGRVVNSSPQGVVIDIGGLEGFVRPQDLAWGTAAAASPERGAKLRVKVLSKPADAQAADQNVYFGVKQLTPNPADALRKKYAPKSVVHGKVVETTPAGLKLQLNDKQAAFCAAAEADPDVAYKPGDAVSAIVQGVHPQTFEVTVSINRFVEIKDRKRLAQYLKAPPPLTLGQLLQPDKGE